MPEAEALFLNTLLDIAEKTLRADWYSMTRAAGLLRQIFLDERPLVHTVNRRLQVPLEFVTIDYTIPLPILPKHDAMNLDVLFVPDAQKRSNSLKQFLAAPCLRSDGVTATVKDLIKACANAKGGIHLGTSKTEPEGLVIKWDETFEILGDAPSTQLLAGICRVSLIGLTPLAKSILANA